MAKLFECRSHCGACCIAPSISSTIPDMPKGKLAGEVCVQLDQNLRCRLFGLPSRPAVCKRLTPCHEMCGDNRHEALNYLTQLEQSTSV